MGGWRSLAWWRVKKGGCRLGPEGIVCGPGSCYACSAQRALPWASACRKVFGPWWQHWDLSPDDARQRTHLHPPLRAPLWPHTPTCVSGGNCSREAAQQLVRQGHAASCASLNCFA